MEVYRYAKTDDKAAEHFKTDLKSILIYRIKFLCNCTGINDVLR
ncbi:hypothetical protein NOBGBDLN_00010 [[Clostridium] scindens]|nr:hypothetical protein NOBGBDLN_00010 [[Clostridium] scindens]